jgi:hypothetical protein
MTSRRRFLITAPISTVGMLAACRNTNTMSDSASDRPARSVSTALTAPSRPAATPRPLLESVPADAVLLQWMPKHEELVYTFGGAAPRQRIKPNTRIVTWTEDCFDGTVKTASDLPSRVMPPGHDNPQSGPFFIEGAEPGDTVAVHILKLEAARTYGVSSFGPGFGALVGTDQTAMLGPGFPEATWRYDIDAARSVARASASVVSPK